MPRSPTVPDKVVGEPSQADKVGRQAVNEEWAALR